jgi:hypothetical protein
MIADQAFAITPVTFRIDSVAVSDNRIDLEWPGREGETFSLEGSVGLSEWVPVATDLAPVEGIVNWSTGADQPFQFFRAVRNNP